MTPHRIVLPPADSELVQLIESLCDGTILPAQRDRLEALLASDPDAKRYYVGFLDIHAQLQWLMRDADQAESDVAIENASYDFPREDIGPPAIVEAQDDLPEAIRPIALDVSLPARDSDHLFTPGGMLFSYSIAAVVLVIGLLIAWSSRFSPEREPTAVAPSPALAKVEPETEIRFVGRITRLLECQVADSSTEVLDDAPVGLGQKISLRSGLLEITYDHGARVILEGPCTYTVDAKDGGYLALGKLAARIDNQPEVSDWKSERHPNDSALRSPHPEPSHARFTVRTPTAVIADLGTEFGIEVDRSGASQTRVFLGSVEVYPVSHTEEPPPVISLTQNETVTIASGRQPKVSVTRDANQAEHFVRDIPRRAKITLFSTGKGLKEGVADVHWQLVARSDQPAFKSQAAIVSPVDALSFLPNDPTRSQWLAVTADLPQLPEETTYTFRTTFDLTGLLPQTAIIRGRCMADDHIRAVRLNGREVPVPPHGWGPFFNWTPFEITSGFAATTNVLEIDVLNGGYPGAKPGARSLMMCRVELDGAATPDWKRKQ